MLPQDGVALHREGPAISQGVPWLRMALAYAGFSPFLVKNPRVSLFHLQCSRTQGSLLQCCVKSQPKKSDCKFLDRVKKKFPVADSF